MAEKLYYTMGEVAEMLDITQSTLRFWERRFDVVKPAKNKKGNRLFSPGDVRNLKTIYHLVKERGMTLEGAQKYMKANRSGIERDMHIAERLQSVRALLVEVRNSLGGEGIVIDDGTGEQGPRTTAHTNFKDEINHIIEEAHEEEVIDMLMEDVLEALHHAPEPMPDFNPEPVFETEEPAGEESAPEQEGNPEEPPRPSFIEQTLF